MNSWKAFLLGAIPVVVVALLSTIGDPDSGGFNPFALLWFLAAAICMLELFALMAFVLQENTRAAMGILAAMVVGVLVLGSTCYVNVAGA